MTLQSSYGPLAIFYFTICFLGYLGHDKHMPELYDSRKDTTKQRIHKRLKLTKAISRATTALTIVGGLSLSVLAKGHDSPPQPEAGVVVLGSLALCAVNIFERGSSFSSSDRQLKAIHRERPDNNFLFISGNSEGDTRSLDFRNYFLSGLMPFSGLILGGHLPASLSSINAGSVAESGIFVGITLGIDYLANLKTFNPIVNEFSEAFNDPRSPH